VCSTNPRGCYPAGGCLRRTKSACSPQTGSAAARHVWADWKEHPGARQAWSRLSLAGSSRRGGAIWPARGERLRAAGCGRAQKPELNGPRTLRVGVPFARPPVVAVGDLAPAGNCPRTGQPAARPGVWARQPSGRHRRAGQRTGGDSLRNSNRRAQECGPVPYRDPASTPLANEAALAPLRAPGW